MTIDAAELGVGARACLHQSRIVKRPRRLIRCVQRDRGLAHLYERPADESGIRIIGRDAIESAEEKAAASMPPRIASIPISARNLSVFGGNVMTFILSLAWLQDSVPGPGEIDAAR